MQVLKIPGLNPAAVHGLLGLCATDVLRPANNWEQPGEVIAASLLFKASTISQLKFADYACDKTKWIFNQTSKQLCLAADASVFALQVLLTLLDVLL